MAQTRWRKMRKIAVLEVTWSCSTQKGDISSKSMSYLSKPRDTRKDHSFTFKMTGNNLKLERNALFIALMATGNHWEPHASLLIRDHCLIEQSAKGYTDDSKDDETMEMIRMQPVWGRDSQSVLNKFSYANRTGNCSSMEDGNLPNVYMWDSILTWPD